MCWCGFDFLLAQDEHATEDSLERRGAHTAALTRRLNDASAEVTVATMVWPHAALASCAMHAHSPLTPQLVEMANKLAQARDEAEAATLREQATQRQAEDDRLVAERAQRQASEVCP